MARNVLVTGAAGFIGFHLCQRLLKNGDRVTGLDNLNQYYDVTLKKDRLKILESEPNFRFEYGALEDRDFIQRLFKSPRFDVTVHLAAQAGIRYSIENPAVYADSNLSGFLNILEGVRYAGTDHLVYASSSSVYGANRTMPFSERDNVDHPVSFYAATKKANELMAHTYSSLFNLPVTGLRFFTVYGPWGRPDMALFKFTKAIIDGKPVEIYNNGDMRRDFTYIDDIIEGVARVMDKAPAPDPSWNGVDHKPESSYAPYRIYNIGNNQPESIMRMVELLESSIGKKAVKKLLPMQAGDMKETAADITLINRDFGFKPSTSFETGVARFVEWYRRYFKV